MLAVTEDVLAIAMTLAHQFWNLGVGAVDLIHVATALESRQRIGVPVTVACADRSMRLLAAAAGFRVFDPEKDDPARLDTYPTNPE